MAQHLQDCREALLAAGWSEAAHPFWRDEAPCFYDLTKTKTVILFRDDDGNVDESLYFWKYEWQEVPDFLDADAIQVRRYKLHHSMNDLLWHDYGDRKIVH